MLPGGQRYGPHRRGCTRDIQAAACRSRPDGCLAPAAEMKMWIISVAPMPSMMRSPVCSNQLSDVAFGSGSPAETQCPQARQIEIASRARSIARYAVGAVNRQVARQRLHGAEQGVGRRSLDQAGARAKAQRKHEQRAQPEREAERRTADVKVIGRVCSRWRATVSAIASTSRWKCTSPSGSPVVPDVKASSATSSAACRRWRSDVGFVAITRLRARRRRSWSSGAADRCPAPPVSTSWPHSLASQIT